MASLFDEDVLLAESSLTRFLLPDIETKRTSSVHEINKRRRIDGEYHHLFQQFKAYTERFYSYTRMNLGTFNYILHKIKCRLNKVWCNFHDPILLEERLVVTLRLAELYCCIYIISWSFQVKLVSNVFHVSLPNDSFVTVLDL